MPLNLPGPGFTRPWIYPALDLPGPGFTWPWIYPALDLPGPGFKGGFLWQLQHEGGKGEGGKGQKLRSVIRQRVQSLSAGATLRDKAV